MSTVRTILTVAILGVAVYGVSLWLHQNGPTALPDLMLSGSAAQSAPDGTGAPASPPAVNIGTPQTGMPGSMGYGSAVPSPYPAVQGIPPETGVQPYPSSAPPASNLSPGPSQPPSVAGTAEMAGDGMPAMPPPSPTVSGCAEFAQSVRAIQPLLDSGQLAEALLQLTQWYGDPRLSPEQATELLRLLDPLAATVIYSYQYPLDGRHYVVQPGETLDAIAGRNEMEWQVLAKINGLADPRQLQPGQQLKLLRGPFHALVDLSDRELTLIVEGRYAGRFPIGIGQDFPAAEATYTVLSKTAQPDSAGRAGYWIGLENALGLHAATDPSRIGQTGGPGFVLLNESDLAELFDLLSVGSAVVVRP